MTYKEFGKWCNARAADGCWSFQIAILCCEEYSKVTRLPFFKKRKQLKENIPQSYQEIVDFVNEHYGLVEAIESGE